MKFVAILNKRSGARRDSLLLCDGPEVDHNIGRILKALEKSGQKDNTLIVFASDNGLAVGQHGF